VRRQHVGELAGRHRYGIDRLGQVLEEQPDGNLPG
jgi:hypothetical protein